MSKVLKCDIHAKTIHPSYDYIGFNKIEISTLKTELLQHCRIKRDPTGWTGRLKGPKTKTEIENLSTSKKCKREALLIVKRKDDPNWKKRTGYPL